MCLPGGRFTIYESTPRWKVLYNIFRILDLDTKTNFGPLVSQKRNILHMKNIIHWSGPYLIKIELWHSNETQLIWIFLLQYLEYMTYFTIQWVHKMFFWLSHWMTKRVSYSWRSHYIVKHVMYSSWKFSKDLSFI